MKEPIIKNTNFCSSLPFYLKNSFREMSRRKLYYILALFSCTIVVTSTSVAQTVIEYTPIIFLRTAESSSGAIDVQLDSMNMVVNEYMPIWNNIKSNNSNIIMGYNGINRNLLLNLTKITNLTGSKLSTARYTFDSTVQSTAASWCGSAAPANAETALKDITQVEHLGKVCPTFNSHFVLLNNSQEIQMSLGDTTIPPMPTGSCAISSKLANILGINIGEYILVKYNWYDVVSDVAYKYNIEKNRNISNYIFSNIIYQTPDFTVPFRVDFVFKELGNKFSDGSYSDYIIADYDSIFQHAGKYFSSALQSNLSASGNRDFASYFQKQTPSDFTESIIFNIPNRVSIYSSTNYDNIQMTVTQFATSISINLGVYPFDMSLPVLQNLAPLKFGSLTLGITLNIIIFVLFILSIILVYNLLLVSIETKQFEMGVLRMLGLDKIGLAQLIFIQAITFVLPGLFLGLILSTPLLSVISNTLKSSLKANLPIFPTGKAAAYSIGLGFLIPILSSFYPMKQALAQNLNIALDLNHSKSNAIHVSIENELKAIPWTRISFSVVAVAFGVSVYYLLPKALLSFDIALLLLIFFWILMGFLVGMILLALNLQHFLERLFVKIFFFYAGVSFKTLIVKNLIGHKMRNQKTAIMYALSLGFVIFITVAADMQIKSAAYQVQQQKGVYLEIKPNYYRYLDWTTLEYQLANNLQNEVDSWAFITDDLNSYLTINGYQSVYVTHVGQLYTLNAKIVGVSPQIFQTTFPEYLITDQDNGVSGLDLGYQLYTARGSQSAVIGKYYANKLDLNLDINSTFIIKMFAGQSTRTEELRVIGVLDAAPAFTFSQLPSSTNQNILVSLPTFMRLSGPDILSKLEFLPVTRLLIKVKNGDMANLGPVVSFFENLRDLSGIDITIWDFRDFQSNLDKNSKVITIIFIAIEMIVMLLCLFSLVSSMTTNIMEQSKEIAILRAIGMTKTTVNLLYVAEAFILVFTSSFLGLIIGTVVGWTMTLQNILFTQLPIPFVFPWMDLIVVLIIAIFSSFLSSYLPAKNITKLHVAKIVRL